MRVRVVLFLVSIALTAALLPAPSLAHSSLRTGRYECWLTQITQYSNFDLKIRSGNRYVFLLGDEQVGRPGEFVHDGQKLRFKSGYLKKKGYVGRHAAFDDAYNTHVIYLYKNGNMVYDCNNN